MAGDAPVAIDLDAGTLPIGSQVTVSATDLTAALASDADDDLSASDISFDEAFVNGGSVGAPANVGFSYTPGAGDNGAFTIDLDNAPALASLASGDTAAVSVNFNVSDGTSSDQGQLSYQVAGDLQDYEAELVHRAPVPNDTEIIAHAVAPTGAHVTQIIVADNTSLQDTLNAADFASDDTPEVDLPAFSSDATIASASASNGGEATAIAEDESDAQATAHDGATATADADEDSSSTAVASDNSSTATAVATDSSVSLAAADTSSSAVASAGTNSNASASASTNSVASASATADSTALAVADDNSAASATASDQSDALALADNGSAADASSAQSASSAAVAENSSVATASATNASASVANSDQTSSATAFSADNSAANADALTSSISNSVSTAGSQSVAAAANTADALAYADLGSNATASANTNSSAAASAVDASAAEADASDASTATANAQSTGDALAVATADSISLAAADTNSVAIANATTDSNATAGAGTNAIVSATAVDDSTAVAAADTDSAATASASTQSDASAVAEHGSAAEATAAQASSSTAVADNSSSTTASAIDDSVSVANSNQTSSATALSADNSVASADALASSISNAVSIMDSAATASAANASDALSFANNGSAAASTADQTSSASAAADAGSKSTASASAASTAVAAALADTSPASASNEASASADLNSVAVALADAGQSTANALDNAAAYAATTPGGTASASGTNQAAALSSSAGGGTSNAVATGDGSSGGAALDQLISQITSDATIGKAALADAAMLAANASIGGTPAPDSLSTPVNNLLASPPTAAGAIQLGAVATASAANASTLQGSSVDSPTAASAAPAGGSPEPVVLSGFPPGTLLSAGTPNVDGTQWSFAGPPPADLSIMPPASYSGSFTLTASTSATGGSATTSQTITVEPVVQNTVPTAAPDMYEVNAGSILVVPAIGVLTNDSDIDHDPLSAELISGTSNGMLGLTPDGAYTYEPNPGFSGTDSFTYRANDGQASSLPATVTITVRPVAPPPANAAPIACDDWAEGNQDSLISGNVLGNDRDPDGDSLSVSLLASVANGMLTLNADGSFSYCPNAGFAGTDCFSYKASDGQADSAATLVTIRVNPVAPTYVEPAYVEPATAASDWAPSKPGTGSEQVKACPPEANSALDDASEMPVANLRTELNHLSMQGMLAETAEFIGKGAFTARGNALDNTLTGGVCNDWLLGLTGNDILIGGDGNDKLDGGAGADRLDGGAGQDILSGGAGPDTFVFSSSLQTAGIDRILDFSAERDLIELDSTVFGLDAGPLQANQFHSSLDSSPPDAQTRIVYDASTGQLSYDGDGTGLVAPIVFARISPNLVLDHSAFQIVDASGPAQPAQAPEMAVLIAGTDKTELLDGSAIDDIIQGKAGDDELNGLAGDDVLDGGTGGDTMRGGIGDDTYLVDNAADQTIELSNEGHDNIQTTLASLSLQNTQIEDLLFTGQGPFDGEGNALDNQITGGAGADRLNGAAGMDRLLGGAGDDQLDGGIDADRLEGGDGNDILTGGDGADTFVFDTELGIDNIDQIIDFKTGIDVIELDSAVFSLPAGVLAAGAFDANGGAAANADTRIIYDPSTGALLFDADGLDGADAVQFATLGANLSLDSSDLIVWG